MVKVAWKVVNGYGPYAYVQKSVKVGNKVKSVHIGYLGKAGTNDVIPGKHINVPPMKDFKGGRLLVPQVGEDTAQGLQPGPLSLVTHLEEQVKKGVPKSKINLTPPKTAATPVAKAAPKKKTASPKPAKAEDAPAAAPTAAKQEAVASLAATLKAKLGATVQVQEWKKVGPQLGSTKGGLYENEKGARYYIKCPATEDHVANELLARDLYQLVGVRTLEGHPTVMEGEPCLATRWEEGLMGSGENPKDLKGTKEGFVADAWLANWDSVGVGSSKYDNILGYKGQAYRVDTGGALLYRGTGGPKGVAFGTEVTELEGLRDPKVNPVAATVYGDMTAAEIEASAKPVLAAPNNAIISAVHKRYPDDPQKASNLATQLLVRKNYIKKWLADQAQKQDKAVEAAPAAALETPKPQSVGPKVTEVPKDADGKPLVSPKHIKHLENVAAIGYPTTLTTEAAALVGKLKSPAKKAALAKVGIDLQNQMIGVKPIPAAAPDLINTEEPKAPTKIKATKNPEDAQGKPLVTAQQIQHLEQVANQGDLQHLHKVGTELSEAAPDKETKQAIITVAANLYGQLYDAQLKAAPGPQPAPPQVETKAPTKIKVTEVPKNAGGKSLVSAANIAKLEALANSKNAQALSIATIGMSQLAKGAVKKAAIVKVGNDLLSQVTGEPTPEHLKDGGLESIKEGMKAKAKAKAELDATPAPQPKTPLIESKEGAADAPAAAADDWYKVTLVPKDAKGKPMVSAKNIKQLEKTASLGPPDALKAMGGILADKLKNPAQKEALNQVVGHLIAKMPSAGVQEGDSGSGLPDTIEKVDDGDLKLPDQKTPTLKTIDAETKKGKKRKQNYDEVLEQVSGQKGSNEGGLFKDKKLETLHYVKWPNSEARAKVEALAALLYTHADVPVPSVRAIKFQGKDAVMSDWIDGAEPMTTEQMRTHPEVRGGFVADAWLANWDVVGAGADNIVSGPGAKAYRIDAGGSMIFRAKGSPKDFSAEVGELESLKDPNTNPQAALAFKDISQADLKAGAERLALITDDQIDAAVDSVKLPKKSKEYPASYYSHEHGDIPSLLKARLKQRRDYIVDEHLDPKDKKKAALEKLDGVDLKPDSKELVAAQAAKYTVNKPSSGQKWTATGTIMENELGSSKGKSAKTQTQKHYQSWKGSTARPLGAALRWAGGELEGSGRLEEARLKKILAYLVKSGTVSSHEADNQIKHVEQFATTPSAKRLVEGLSVARKQNEATLGVKYPGKDTVTVYRGWNPSQLKYLKLDNLKVGDEVTLKDPPFYSWSLSPSVAHNFGGGHGSIVAKAQVPLSKVVLTDLVNSIGSYEGEDEIIFKGIDNYKMEVIKKS